MALDEIVAPISGHGAAGLAGRSRGGKMAHQGSLTSFRRHDDLDDLVAEGDKVVERFTFVGTQKGDFLGVPAMANKSKSRHVDLSDRERRSSSTGAKMMMGLLMQLRVLRRQVSSARCAQSGCDTKREVWV
jgi:hypothetical protein